MEKQPLPPSYNEVFPSAPSAPSENMMQQQAPPYPLNQAPYPTQNAPVYPAQPMVYSQQIPVQQQPLLQGQQPQQIIVMSQVHLPLGPQPIGMTCFHCNQQTVTKTEYQSSTMTHILALVLCFFCFPCCLFPYCCCDNLKDVEHRCSKCNHFIGMYKRQP